ncbi:MAG: GNAT family N-acetyltransferase [Chloroflexota bacterium]|nr:GNAT family N-acetyltransferase [Chloroflexota bacterium]MDE2931875.1 GNAT family N-acetyltransferase [Chloroflexota bacterium]
MPVAEDFLKELSIRPYEPRDEARVKELTIAAFTGVSIENNIEHAWPGLLPVPWGERKWPMVAMDLTAHPEECFVVEYDGEVIGYATTRINRTNSVGQIPDMAVDEKFRGKGIGRMLLEHCLQYFRDQNLILARIETLDQNPIGRHLYPDLGFEEVARQIFYAMPLEPQDE